MKLLIVADDYTGALDTGVKLAQQGVSTAVVGMEDFCQAVLERDVDVLVVSTETRHASPQRAYETVYRLVKLARGRWPETALYKKTDSALRGNVGSELAAMMEAAEETFLAYVPALPSQGRVTLLGSQMDHGQPIHETVFSKDCYEPVTCAFVPAILGAQTGIRTRCVPVGQAALPVPGGEAAIWVYDCASQQDMRAIARALKAQGRQRVTAGCAGFAEELAFLLELRGGAPARRSPPCGRLCVVCGSINPISQGQMAMARRHGMYLTVLPAKDILGDGFDARAQARRMLAETPAGCSLMISTADQGDGQEKITYARQRGMTLEVMRCRIQQRLGELTRQLLAMDRQMLPMLIGGDTLYGFLQGMGGGVIWPACEWQPGCVLARYGCQEQPRWMLTKSGGVGSEDVLLRLREKLEVEIHG